MTTTFVVERQKLAQTRWVHADPAPLAAGEVRLAVDSFALTANNITYAAFGDAMNYWGFFPTGDTATGCIPVWGFADVTESRCDGVAVGERFYGYWPIADEVVLQPARVNDAGFFDGAAHRPRRRTRVAGPAAPRGPPVVRGGARAAPAPRSRCAGRSP